jgi:hypothetical protein
VVSIKTAPGHIMSNLVFASDWICGLRSRVRCVQVKALVHYFSYSDGLPCGFHKNYVETRYVKLVFMHPMGSAVYVVHSGASAP